MFSSIVSEKRQPNPKQDLQAKQSAFNINHTYIVIIL